MSSNKTNYVPKMPTDGFLTEVGIDPAKKNELIKRSSFLNGNIRVIGKPERFTSGPPLRWSKAGTLLRIPKVVSIPWKNAAADFDTLNKEVESFYPSHPEFFANVSDEYYSRTLERFWSLLSLPDFSTLPPEWAGREAFHTNVLDIIVTSSILNNPQWVLVDGVWVEGTFLYPSATIANIKEMLDWSEPQWPSHKVIVYVDPAKIDAQLAQNQADWEAIYLSLGPPTPPHDLPPYDYMAYFFTDLAQFSSYNVIYGGTIDSDSITTSTFKPQIEEFFRF